MTFQKRKSSKINAPFSYGTCVFKKTSKNGCVISENVLFISSEQRLKN